MKILVASNIQEFPFKWANLEYLPDSISTRCEIYLKDTDNLLDGLIDLFNNLFENHRDELIIYDKSWWDFPLETWDIDNDIYDYKIIGKTPEVQEYLNMLLESDIKAGYSGCCRCENGCDSHLM